MSQLNAMFFLHFDTFFNSFVTKIGDFGTNEYPTLKTLVL